MLQLTNVSKSYDDRVVLEPLSLTVEPHQTLVLIGPSGCGKSTLIRLMIGLIEPDTGSVLVDDEPVTGPKTLEIRHRFGYVIQGGGLFTHLTARENVTLLANHIGWSRDRMTSRVEELRNLTHLGEGLLDRYPTQMSGGQQQRVSLMRALMLDPEVLLLDEPLGALDPLIRADLQQDLKEIFQSLGKTVVLVTHDIGEAAYLSDDILLMKAGRVIQHGTIDQLTNQPADQFVADFIRAQRSPFENNGADS